MANENIYQLKITLSGIKPTIWRRLLIPGDWNFCSLHNAIQDAMGWRDRHLYFFEGMNHKTYSNESIEPHNDVSSQGISDKIEKVCDYFQNPRDKMKYVYDMGDYWEHLILLEKILPKDASTKYPKCLAGKRACPPEDCGGIDEYKPILEILRDRTHKEYEDYNSWLNRYDYETPFDPEKFEAQSIYNDWESKRAQVLSE